MGATLTQRYGVMNNKITYHTALVGWASETDPYDYHVTEYGYNSRFTIVTDAYGGTSVAISGIAVAVIGFTLTFGAAVFGMLKMGVGAVDRGQYEAAYALGHSNRHTFFRIILPQAIPHVLPAYQGEIVGLIKATAIVGYIAVQDLTKMGDIVRSRTYEAFFPLIAITVIYFVLEGLFSFAVSRIRIRIDPKKRRRDRILKGVKIDDQD